MTTQRVEKPILDACCGSRMFWFDKENPMNAEYAAKAEIQRVQKVCDMQALLVSEYQELICEFLGMKNGNRKISPHDAKMLLIQLKMLHEREIPKDLK